MSFKQYMVLFFMFMGYLLLGATMFYSVERPLEEERKALARAEALQIRELLQQHYAKGVPQAHLELLTRLSDYCGKPFYIDSLPVSKGDEGGNDTDDTVTPSPTEEPYEETPYLWSFYNSLLFVICTLSTIGYGNLAPTSRHGRILDVIYGLFGIPFMGIVLAQMSDYFGSLFMRAHHRYKSHEYQTRLSLFADILTYLILGMIIFIFFPAAIFVYFEDWTFDTGVYYAFVTLATIGYGDLVAGQNGSDTLVYNFYKVMVLVWIMFGLGYMLMIVGFLTRAMRSKKVRKIEHKLANTIKQTQSKIWNEFSQDVTYLRRMLNEMYLMKIQPVYVEKETGEDKEGVRRVKSCPNLTEWPILCKKVEESESSEEDEEEMAANFRRIAMRRRKGNAENLMAPRTKKTVSEGDLSRIDRKATFGEDTGTLDPKLLLAKVVDALGTSVGSKFSLENIEDRPSRKPSMKLNGIHGFSDDEILASERLPSRWSLGGRKRTISEHTTPVKRNSLAPNEELRTWGGVCPEDVERFIKLRANGDLRRSSHAFETPSISASSKSSLNESDLKSLPSRMRRMSMAVSSLFSQAAKSKSQDLKDHKELRDSKKKRRTGNVPGMLANLQNKRKSLPHEDQAQSMLEQVNYLSQTTGRRGSVFAALASEIGSKPNQGANIPVSPVLEQTSVADFLRLLSSLQAKLDPTLSLPLENRENSLTNKKKSVIGDSVADSLAMLFSPPTSNLPSGNDVVNSSQPLGGPVNLPHHGQRRVSIAPNFLEAKGKQGRRFSLIPPMDVDHPSGQTNRHIMKLKKRSTSSQNMLQQSDGSTITIPGFPSRSRLQRPSPLAASAKYISSKLQNSSDVQITGPPNETTSQEFRKFLVRPVSSVDVPLQQKPDAKPNPQVPKQTLPTITVENFDAESSTIEVEDDDSLKDIIVVRL